MQDPNDTFSIRKMVSQMARTPTFRIGLVFVCLLGVFSYEAIKLFNLHLGNHARIERSYRRTILGKRGRIFDRNGDDHPMAISLPAWQFFLDPQSVKTNHNPEVIAQAIATNLNLDIEWVREQFHATGPGSRHIKLAVSQRDDIYKPLLDSKDTISGIGADEIIIRRYPQGRRMSHVLGFVNYAGIGSAGIEQVFNTELSAVSGIIESEKDATRREIFDRRKIVAPPIAGHDIYLTLDHHIQYEVETALRETVEKFDALRGWIIIQKIKTGELLALATFPDFEPEHYQNVPNTLWQNYALGTVYEPGSIMKAVTVSAFLNERLGTPNTLIDVGEGTWNYANRPLRDHVTGRITVATALKKSSNIACAKMALSLGDKKLYAYLRAFNFGSKFGIELPGEEKGILHPVKEWSKLSPTRIAIGQGIAVTGLQMVSVYSALANGGVMMRPYLVDKIVNANGEVIRQTRPEIIGHPVRPAIAKQVCEMLAGVTESDGTGKRAAVSGYSVAGKTGTAQKAVRGGYSNTDYFASFVGFVPASDPVFTILVTIERPRPQHTGGFVSAPVFARLAASTARYLEVPPDQPDELEDQDAAFPPSR